MVTMSARFAPLDEERFATTLELLRRAFEASDPVELKELAADVFAQLESALCCLSRGEYVHSLGVVSNVMLAFRQLPWDVVRPAKKVLEVLVNAIVETMKQWARDAAISCAVENDHLAFAFDCITVFCAFCEAQRLALATKSCRGTLVAATIVTLGEQAYLEDATTTQLSARDSVPSLNTHTHTHTHTHTRARTL
jgi:hypothetical protein